MATLTGSIIAGNHIGAPTRSCKPTDVPTKQRVTVTLDGIEYERTVYERVIWKNMRPNKAVARFVIIDGTNHEVEL